MNTMRRRAAIVLLGLLAMIGLVSPVAAQATPIAPAFQADCPPTIRCIVAPAAFTAIDGNIEDYGNYDTADRPTDMAITSIVIHDGEGTCDDIVKAFQDPRHYAATQYTVCRDGTVYQHVQNKHVPWHAGNWYCNMHCIGIEHEGHAALGGTEYTPAMYWASAQLVKYLTSEYSIPRDRGHIIGHDNIQAIKASQIAGMHTDPGPFWNWQNYMALIGAPVLPSGGWNSGFVTVAPTWPLSKQTVTGCSPGNNNGCVPDGLQPTNFVYLRTEPNLSAPLFTDPVLGQGTTDISSDAARLFHGQTFALNGQPKIEQGGIWYQVWVNGKTGWFYSPWNAPTALPGSGKYITPKAGKSTIPVYGRPSPERSAYPADLLASPPASFWIPTLAPEAPLPYTIAAGQRYRVIDASPVNDHFYAWSLTADRTRFPYDHTVFRGETRFVEIQFGNRVGFVKLDDVDMK